MRRHTIIGTFGALVATIVLAGTALGAAFDNGGFEDANTNVGPFKEVTGSAIPGWTIAGAVDWIGTYWAAPQGDKSVDMNATPTQGTLSQQIDTSANSTYVVGFKLSGNPNCGIENKTLTVQAAGKAAQTFIFEMPADASNSNMTWVTEGYSFTGNGPTATLVFASTTTGACGPAIDAVTVTETVATGAQCKSDGWRSMVDKYGTPFKNQGDCVSYYATGERNLAAGG